MQIMEPNESCVLSLLSADSRAVLTTITLEDLRNSSVRTAEWFRVKILIQLAVTAYIFFHTLLAVMESLPHRKRSVQIIRQSLSVMYVCKL